MKIPNELRVSKSALEIRMCLKPVDVKAGRHAIYALKNNTGDDTRLLASIAVRKTDQGYDILRRFCLPGQPASKIGFSLSPQDADRAAYHYAQVLASRLPSAPVPTYDLVSRDQEKLARELGGKQK